MLADSSLNTSTYYHMFGTLINNNFKHEDIYLSRIIIKKRVFTVLISDAVIGLFYI